MTDDEIPRSQTIAQAESILAARYRMTLTEAAEDLRCNAAYLGMPVSAFATYIVDSRQGADAES